MRILSISAQKPHSTGSGFYLSALVRALDDMGCAQAVVAGVYPEDTVHFPDGVAFFPVVFNSPEFPFPMPGMSDEMPYPSTLYSSMDDDMARHFLSGFTAHIRAAVEQFRPDAIICHHLYMLTARVREEFPDKKVFGICHGTCLRQLANTPLMRDYTVRNISGLDGIFCLHASQLESILGTFDTDRSRVAVLGSGYDSGIFRPIPSPPHTGYRLAYAGKIAEKKGVFSLIRALGRLDLGGKELSLSLAGGYANADYSRATELIRQCPYPVELLGPLPQAELARLFSKTDLFILPSYYEGLPLVLAEALACGTKVICTDLPGIRPWMDANVPGHGIRFIAPPAMLGADTPKPSSLPAFESSIAAAIAEELQNPPQPIPDLSGLSWANVAGKLLDGIK